MSSAPKLPAPRRVVTKNTPEGKAVVSIDESIDVKAFSPDVDVAMAWVTDSLPVEYKGDEDGAKIALPGLVHPTGSIIKFVDFAPGFTFGLHYTHSIDYAVIISGEIVMELSDGALTPLKQSDVVVQQGTLHAWHNKSSEWARILFVTIPSKPVEINGKPLEGQLYP